MRRIEWLLATIDGSPVIVEAVTLLYHWGSRVSIYTDLPDDKLVGLASEAQLAILPGDVVDRRINDVNQIFGAATRSVPASCSIDIGRATSTWDARSVSTTRV